MFPIFQTSDSMLAVILCMVAGAFWAQRFKPLKLIGPALLVIITGIILVNLNIVTGSCELYGVIQTYCIPLSTSLYLLNVDFKKIVKMSKQPLMSIGSAVFCVCLGMGVQIADPQSTLPLVIVLVIALILAIVAVIFVEPAIIICTGISGGVTAGISAAAAMGLEGIWPGYAIGAVAAILGMVVQFMMHSRKVGKKEKVYAEQVKEADSVESEVEKARMVLDDPEEPEDEDE